MSQEQERTASTVLVFEADPSLRRLITLGLLHHGFAVVEAASLASLSTIDIGAVDLLVFDVDAGGRSNWKDLENLSAHPYLSSTARIVLAWDPVDAEATATIQTPATFLPKPFDARALHASIKRLLDARSAEKRAREAEVEAALLAAYTRHAPPSAWPLVTAIGLLLFVCGLLVHPVLVALGVLVAVSGLLLWTLGRGPETTDVSIGLSQN